MLLIEKQALVQVLIRESAHALATNKGRQVSNFLVSIQICINLANCQQDVLNTQQVAFRVSAVTLWEVLSCFWSLFFALFQAATHINCMVISHKFPYFHMTRLQRNNLHGNDCIGKCWVSTTTYNSIKVRERVIGFSTTNSTILTV